MTDSASVPRLTIVPANEASCEHLCAVFGARGGPARCRCQRFKTRGRQWDSEQAAPPVEERAARLRQQTRCGHPEADTTSGLLAYLDGEPVGWCAVETRTAYVRLGRVPWAGRSEDKADNSVWAVTCFMTRTGYRRAGLSRALARAAVDFARERGARARGLPDDHAARTARHVGRAPCRQPGHLRARRVRRGQPADPAPRRDAHRLLAWA